MRRRGLIAVVVVVAAAGTFAYWSLGGSSARACADIGCVLHVAPDGSDSAPCSALRPCKSFNGAYHKASPGQTVELAAGTYPAQKLSEDDSKSSPSRIVFRPAPGARVVVPGIDVHAKHVEFRGLRVTESWTTWVEAEDVVFRNITGGLFYVNSSRNVSVIGGSYGPAVDAFAQVAPWPSDVEPENITVDGVSFHDMIRHDPKAHLQCLEFGAGNGIVVRNSRFTNCNDFDLMIANWGDVPLPRNIRVENNFFGATTESMPGFTAYYSVLSGGFQNTLFRHNRAEMPIEFHKPTGAYANVKVVENVAPQQPWACDSRITYTRNVWHGARCASSDRNVSKRTFEAALRRP